MKKALFLTGAMAACLIATLVFAISPLKTKNLNARKSVLSKKFKHVNGTVSTYFENAASAGAEIKLTSTSGGTNYDFYVNAHTNVSTNTIADGTYNILITEFGPGTLHVERCATDLIGIPGDTVPYTFTGYSTSLDGHLVVVTD